MRQVWMNGQLVPESEARISIYDSALMFGDMVFEMTRSFNKIHFKLPSHLERLYASARYLHIPMPLGDECMSKAVDLVTKVNDPEMAEGDEHRILVNVSRGALSIYQQVQGIEHGTNIIIADFPLRWTVRGMGRLFDEGIDAVIPSQRSIPAHLLEPKIKSRSRMHLMLANIQASRMRGKNVWPLLLDPDGFISEGTGDNFFIVRNGWLITPEPRNILRGISRQFVMHLAKALAIEVKEANISPYDVYQADEAFMTGTPFCMLPVVSLDGVQIGSGRPGNIFQTILRRWSFCVHVDIPKQIKRWNETDEKIVGSSPYQFSEES